MGFDRTPRTYFCFPGPYTLEEERATFQDALNTAAVKLNNIRATNKVTGSMVPERVSFEKREVTECPRVAPGVRGTGWRDAPVRRWTLSSEDVRG